MRTSHVLTSALAFSLQAAAATAIETNTLNGQALRDLVLAAPDIHYYEILRDSDHQNTLHIRLQQTHDGIKVWGADSIVHIPKADQKTQAAASLITQATTMDGVFFRDIAGDLPEDPKAVYTPANRRLALEAILKQYPDFANSPSTLHTEPVIFIDRQFKAHWALKLVLDIPETTDSRRARPAWLLDATRFSVFLHWNDLKTRTGTQVSGGGYGGNHKTGQLRFDGPPNLPAFTVTRDDNRKICSMQHDYLIMRYAQWPYRVVEFDCTIPDATRGSFYWNGDFDHTDTTWSPANDVMFGEQAARQMYMDWYHIPVLTTRNNKPLRLRATVHSTATNAWWDNNEVVFGDSLDSKRFNPFTQLDTVVHEISHGFTEQHSNLNYAEESGGINEAFSDMAGIAAEYYVYGSTHFEPGFGDIKAPGKSLRYMDRPSRDCEGRDPGRNCSIDHAGQYIDGLNVHFSSGVYNRLYYLLATSPGWNPKMAFDIMVEANRHYWRSNETFQSAACGLLKATRALNYSQKDVTDALAEVHLNASCAQVEV